MRSFCLSLFISCFLFPTVNYAQCPGCVINDCSATLPDGGICNATLPNGTTGQAYSEDVSFYMPAQVNFPDVGLIDLNRVQIVSIAGLPFGLDWESSASANANQYFPQNGQELGCIKLCGTPLAAGTYDLTVFLLADVCGIPIIGCLNDVSQTYETQLTIDAGIGGAATFKFNPAGGCGTTDVVFEVDSDFISGPAAEVSIPFPNNIYSKLGLADPPFTNLSNGVLTGRPFANGSCCSGSDPATDITRFTVDVTGSYNINQTQPGWDGYILVYEGPLNWGVNPPANFIAGNDDGVGGIGTSEIIGVYLVAGRTYYLVTTGFSSGDVGSHITLFSGPGNVGTPAFSYEWDFGNGNTSSDEVPPVQNYSPGTYTVSMTTIIDTVGYDLQSLTINGSSCNDCTIFGCTGLPVEFPDYIVTIFDGINASGSSIYQTGEFSDAIEPLGIPLIGLVPQLGNQIYSLDVIDVDPPLNPNDDCGTVNFDGYSEGSFTLTDGGLSIDVVIAHPVVAITASADLTIFPEFNVILAASKDSFCTGEQAILTVTPQAAAYQWFLDTLELVGVNTSTYPTTVPGTYTVIALDSNGCIATTNAVDVSFNTCICDTNVVITSSKDPLLCFGDTTILSANAGFASYLWSNGSTDPSIVVGASGTFTVVATDSEGCISTDDIFVNVQSNPVNPPSNPMTSNITSNSATLGWTTVLGVDHYELRGRVSGSQMPFVVLGIPSPLTNSLNVSGLFPNITYEWQIRSFCDEDEVSPSDWSPLATFTTLGACSAPVAVTTTNVTSSSATLNWTPVSTASQYRIYGRPVGSTSIAILSVAAPASSFNVSNLTPATSYEWAVTSVCSGTPSGLSPAGLFTTSATAVAKQQIGQLDVEQNGIVVYPNPFRNKSSILFPKPDQSYTIELFDPTGKSVFRDVHSGGNTYQLDRKNLSQGVYMLEVRGNQRFREFLIIH